MRKLRLKYFIVGGLLIAVGSLMIFSNIGLHPDYADGVIFRNFFNIPKLTYEEFKEINYNYFRAKTNNSIDMLNTIRCDDFNSKKTTQCVLTLEQYGCLWEDTDVVESGKINRNDYCIKPKQLYKDFYCRVDKHGNITEITKRKY